jgi:predicted RNA polymerase sigma factor
MFTEVHFNRAKLLKDLDRLEEALAGYDKCVNIASVSRRADQSWQRTWNARAS